MGCGLCAVGQAASKVLRVETRSGRIRKDGKFGVAVDGDSGQEFNFIPLGYPRFGTGTTATPILLGTVCGRDCLHTKTIFYTGLNNMFWGLSK